MAPPQNRGMSETNKGRVMKLYVETFDRDNAILSTITYDAPKQELQSLYDCFILPMVEYRTNEDISILKDDISNLGSYHSIKGVNDTTIELLIEK